MKKEPPKPTGFRCFLHVSCDNQLKLMWKHSPAVFKQNVKMAFTKAQAKELFFPQQICLNYIDFEREGKSFFSKASFSFVIFPWNLARLILLVKENFCWSKDQIMYWGWFYRFLKFRLCLHNLEVDNSTLKNDFYLGFDRKFPFSVLIIFLWNFFVQKLKEWAKNRFYWF